MQGPESGARRQSGAGLDLAGGATLEVRGEEEEEEEGLSTPQVWRHWTKLRKLLWFP